MSHPLQDSSSAVSPDTVLIRSGSEGELFKKILGARWLELHPDIRRRFECNPAPGEPLRYQGVLSELRWSRVGKLLGHLTQPFIKGALIPHSDADVAVDIQVYAKPNDPAIYKQRIYRPAAAHLHVGPVPGMGSGGTEG